jgi:hypothetical protein
MPSLYNTTVVANPQLAEAGKFVDLSQNTRFPSVSVLRIHYPDKTAAFPGNTGALPVSSYEIYPKYGVISYIANTDEFAVSLSAGQVNLDTSNLEAHVGNIQADTDAMLPILVATEWNTFDTLTAIATFNNNYLNTISALRVTINNPISSVNIASTSNVLPVSGTVTITNSLSTTPVGTQLVTFADSPQLDANHRLRVVLPQQSWWYVSSVDKDGDLRLIESATQGASSIFVQNLASVTMTPGTSSTGSIIRASRRRFKVRPGVSHQWTGTVNFDGQDDGTIKRLGLFTSYNGMFFELSGADLNVVVRRRLTDGTLAEERVNRNNFNGDKLDGNGPSGQNWSTILSGSITAGTNRWPVAIPGDGNVYNTEFTYTNSALSAIKLGTKATILGVAPSGYNGTVAIAAVNTTTNKLTATYVIDPGTYSSVSNATITHNGYHNAHTLFFEFNGGRTAVTHFGINGSAGPTYLHTFDFSNTLGLQYESAPALMDRKEILNYKALSYNPSMTIDGTAFTIEAESELNPGFGVARNDNYLLLDYNTPAGGDKNEYPLLAIGLRTGEPHQRSDIQIQSINIVDINNIGGSNNGGAVAWRLLLNPTLSGTLPTPTNIGKTSRQWAYTTSSDHTTNGVNLSAGANSQGIELLAGYTTSNATIDVKTALNFLNMGSNIDYTDADKIVLMVKQLSPAAKDAWMVANINFIEAL